MLLRHPNIQPYKSICQAKYVLFAVLCVFRGLFPSQYKERK